MPRRRQELRRLDDPDQRWFSGRTLELHERLGDRLGDRRDRLADGHLPWHRGTGCSGPIAITAHETKKGKKIVGVTARKRKPKTLMKQVSVASGSYSLPAGQTANVKVTLNHTGKQLLGQFKTLGRRSPFRRPPFRRDAHLPVRPNPRQS